MSLVFEYPIDLVLAGEKRSLPSAYIDGKEIEYNEEYPVKLRLTRSIPPKMRLEGSVIALYMLLYLGKPKPVIKLGSISMYSNSSAAMLWAQAPIYARIVGVFHLTKTIGLEEVENSSRKILLNSEYKSIFKFVTKRDNLFNSYNIVKMWINPDGNNTEKLISEVDSIAEFLLDSILKKLDYVEILYDGAGFQTPQQSISLLGNFETFDTLKTVLKNNGGVKGLFRVFPMGLCMFTPVNESKGNSNVNTLYIDICREFVYNTRMYLISEKNTGGVRGYE